MAAGLGLGLGLGPVVAAGLGLGPVVAAGLGVVLAVAATSFAACPPFLLTLLDMLLCLFLTVKPRLVV